MKKKFDVIGMTCSACSAHVDKALRGLDGIKDVNVNLLNNCMTVEYDENVLTDQQIMNAVDKAGYKKMIKRKNHCFIHSYFWFLCFICVWDICLVSQYQLFYLDMKI